MLDSLPAAPARVLEVGAGGGELATLLTAAGYEVVAIDPASTAEHVLPVALEELEGPDGSFDAAVAVVSLHHVEPLVGSCRRLAELVRAGGILVLDEFDVDFIDERAASWWLDRHGAHARDLQEDRHGPQAHDLQDPQAVIAELRRHCHPLAHLQQALTESFALQQPTRGPYLYRWDLSPELRAQEEELIARGRLPATGARMLGVRR